ncbi:MAG: type II/IV secretion system protein [Candidatus Omnitrophica bacterium]|nr:type II/IV secretion system protein [Candidatus Omnitrophota bacterium]
MAKESARKEDLLEFLLKEGLLDRPGLQRVQEAQTQTGSSVVEAVLELGLVPEDKLVSAVARRSRVEAVDLNEEQPDPEAVKSMPVSAARMYRVVPLRISGVAIVVGMAEPDQLSILDDLRFVCGRPVVPVACSPRQIQKALGDLYGAEEANLGALLGEATKAAEKGGLKESEAAGGAGAGLHVVQLLDAVMLEAVKQRASDIHLEPFETSFRIRLRIDGFCHQIATAPLSLAPVISSRVKVMAGLDVAENRIPQDGRIMTTIQDRSVDLRVSTLPTLAGESVVMRVLDRGSVQLNLMDTGMPKLLQERIHQLASLPNGMVLVTGPTGSGKTTTLYACLKLLNKPGTKIITTEDPVEYQMRGVVQIPVNPKIELHFARVLRHILRHDPDIIMVGEIRDEETAQIAVQAALTGHLVLSTLHTNDAPSTITRLVDMGVEPYLLTSVLQGIVAQRLVRMICSECRQKVEPDGRRMQLLGLMPQDLEGKVWYEGAGCESCDQTGYRGRVGIFELLELNEELRSAVATGCSTGELRSLAKAQGVVSLRDDGLRCVYEGITTVDEVLRATQT